VAGFGELRDLARLREIAVVMSRHGFAPAMQRIPVLRSLVGVPLPGMLERPAADRFATMLEVLGPTFVKLGQILSTRGDLLPPDFIAALARLQDQVPPFPFDDVKKQVEGALGKPLAELFTSFDEKPLASASMAQVHAATLASTGEAVVVKVQRPGIADQVRGDAAILVVLAQLLELVVEEASSYRVTDLVEEFRRGLDHELDFSLEAQSLLTFRRLNEGRGGVHVPKLVHELSTRTVMVMERIHGRRITELKNMAGGSRTAEVVERLVSVAFDHIFVDGMFHGDPHPGNVLVTDDFDLAFIDFGLVGRVSRDAQDRFLMLLLALSLRDADTLCRLIMRLGAAEGRVALGPFREAIGLLLDRYLGLQIAQVNSSEVLSDLIELSMRFGIRMPREFALLSKAAVSIEGIVRTLHPAYDPGKQLTARAQGLLLERLDPRQWTSGGLRRALQLGLLLEELPLQLGQVLMDLERGDLHVNFRAKDLEGIDNVLRGLGMTIFGGLLASASVLGSFYWLARQNAGFLPAIGFGVAGLFFGVAFTWYWTGGKLPKIPLARFLGGRRAGGRRGPP
jgi:ubiquinone biosynthesis protein